MAGPVKKWWTGGTTSEVIFPRSQSNTGHIVIRFDWGPHASMTQQKAKKTGRIERDNQSTITTNAHWRNFFDYSDWDLRYQFVIANWHCASIVTI